jgi:hypothetical protein
VVGGANGAAARLGVPRTTLIAKMQKLGLSRELPPRAETHEDHAPSFWGKTPALPLGRFAAAARASI